MRLTATFSDQPVPPATAVLLLLQQPGQKAACAPLVSAVLSPTAAVLPAWSRWAFSPAGGHVSVLCHHAVPTANARTPAHTAPATTPRLRPSTLTSPAAASSTHASAPFQAAQGTPTQLTAPSRVSLTGTSSISSPLGSFSAATVSPTEPAVASAAFAALSPAALSPSASPRTPATASPPSASKAAGTPAAFQSPSASTRLPCVPCGRLVIAPRALWTLDGGLEAVDAAAVTQWPVSVQGLHVAAGCLVGIPCGKSPNTGSCIVAEVLRADVEGTAPSMLTEEHAVQGGWQRGESSAQDGHTTSVFLAEQILQCDTATRLEWVRLPPAPHVADSLDTNVLVQRVTERLGLGRRHQRSNKTGDASSPTGLLLVGPSGSGKTTLAQRVAQRSGLVCVTLSALALGDDEIHRAATDATLAGAARACEAAHGTSRKALLLLDDLDALRLRPQAAHTLAGWVTGVLARGDVEAVIGCCRDGLELPPALRTIPQLTSEEQVLPPSRAVRAAFLAPEVDAATAADLADLTAGYSWSDLTALRRLLRLAHAAAFQTKRGGSDTPSHATEDTSVSETAPHGLVLNVPAHPFLPNAHLLQPPARADTATAIGRLRRPLSRRAAHAALAHVRPAGAAALAPALAPALRLAPPVFAGYERALSRLRPVFASVREPTFARFALAPPSGVLLHGPPGCGKTSLVRVLVHALSLPLFAPSPAALLSRYLGETERNIRELFRAARAAQPCIVFFDNIDALSLARGGGEAGAGGEGSGGGGGTGVGERALSTLLNEIDGVTAGGRVLVVACTSLPPELLDAALLRPGRLEVHEQLGLPSEANRRAICRAHLVAIKNQARAMTRSLSGAASHGGSPDPASSLETTPEAAPDVESAAADDTCLAAEEEEAIAWLAGCTPGWTGAALARCVQDALVRQWQAEEREQQENTTATNSTLRACMQRLVEKHASAAAAAVSFSFGTSA